MKLVKHSKNGENLNRLSCAWVITGLNIVTGSSIQYAIDMIVLLVCSGIVISAMNRLSTQDEKDLGELGQ